MNIVDNFVHLIASSLGVRDDEARLTLGLFLSYALALSHRALPNDVQLKHLFCFLSGISLSLFLYGFRDALILLTIALISYLCMRFWNDEKMPMFVLVLLMFLLSLTHIIRMRTKYGESVMDLTCSLMVIVQRLSSLAFNIQDGRVKPDLLTPEQKRLSCKVPNVLEYLGFTFFYPGFIVGPYTEYKYYQDFNDMTMFKDKDGKPLNKIPPSGIEAFKTFCFGLAFFVGIGLGGIFTSSYMLSSEFLYEKSFFYKLYYINVSQFLSRFPYYFVWHISEGAAIASGFAFNNYDAKGQPKWNRCHNVNVWQLESGQNWKAIFDNWNIHTGQWLRSYVYVRVTPRGKKPNTWATIITFFVSAFWHGWYGGYYLAFITAGWLTNVARVLRRQFRPYFMEKDGTTPKSYKWAYDILTWAVTLCVLHYVTTAFSILAVTSTLKIWYSVYFFGHIGGLVLYLTAVYVLKTPPNPSINPDLRATKAQ